MNAEELPIGRYAPIRDRATVTISPPAQRLAAPHFHSNPAVVEQIHPDDLAIGMPVGLGASAEVFRATWKGQPVAVKMLFHLMPRSDKEMTTLNREVQILAQAQHPNLVRLYGVCLGARPLRIVTDFCEGGNLADLIYDPGALSLTWDQKLQIAADTAAGMVYLHNHNIIHRDLKSPNLLLDKKLTSVDDTPHCKISDFGLAKMHTDKLGAMTTQVGTLLWMAPEMFNNRFYNEKVDVYSFALVLFEVICEEQPFEDVDPSHIESKVSKGERPDLEAVPPECPQPLLQLMTHSWAAKPDARPSFEHILKVLVKLEPNPESPLNGHTRAPSVLQQPATSSRLCRRRYMSL
mmetsp:Transcript_41925/g.98317  ORF Transcript_41925/g.98317 Transcript_41925/m.98317 type:complete len:349 (-) Transcript_41925:44-1090(-)